MTDKTVTVSARILKEDRDYLLRSMRDYSLRTLIESVVKEVKNGRMEIRNGEIKVARNTDKK